MHSAQQLGAGGLDGADGLEVLDADTLHVLRATCVYVAILLFVRRERRVLPLVL